MTSRKLKISKKRASSPDDELLDFLSDYQRITIKIACDQTRDAEEHPRLAVWVRENVEWARLSEARVERLWRANSRQRSRSFCNFLSRDLLKASTTEYEHIRRTFNDPKSTALTGIYQLKPPGGRQEPYAVVVELPRSRSVSDMLVGGASTAAIGALGAAALWAHRTKPKKAHVNEQEELMMGGIAGTDNELQTKLSLLIEREQSLESEVERKVQERLAEQLRERLAEKLAEPANECVALGAREQIIRDGEASLRTRQQSMELDIQQRVEKQVAEREAKFQEARERDLQNFEGEMTQLRERLAQCEVKALPAHNSPPTPIQQIDNTELGSQRITELERKLTELQASTLRERAAIEKREALLQTRAAELANNQAAFRDQTAKDANLRERIIEQRVSERVDAFRTQSENEQRDLERRLTLCTTQLEEKQTEFDDIELKFQQLAIENMKVHRLEQIINAVKDENRSLRTESLEAAERHTKLQEKLFSFDSYSADRKFAEALEIAKEHNIELMTQMNELENALRDANENMEALTRDQQATRDVNDDLGVQLQTAVKFIQQRCGEHIDLSDLDSFLE